MAWITLNFRSDQLRQETSVQMVAPEMANGMAQALKDCPLVFLLHGFTNNQNRWLLDTNVHALAKQHGLCIVMPYGGNSFYSNTVSSGNVEAYLTEELPLLLSQWFGMDPLKPAAIAGNSMGAYGATKLGLLHNRFYAIGAFSGPLDIRFMEQAKQIDQDDYTAVTHDFADLTEWAPGGNADPVVWLQRYQEAVQTKKRTPVDLAIYCGEQDPLLPMSQSFALSCQNLGIPMHYQTSPGQHDFLYWEVALHDWLQRIFVKEEA